MENAAVVYFFKLCIRLFTFCFLVQYLDSWFNYCQLTLPLRHIAGMTSRDFKGIPSLQEVECSGGILEPEVKLLSLQIRRLYDDKELSSLNVFSNSCVTAVDYSSCVIDTSDSHKSRLRTLVHDLDEGQSREYRCTVYTVTPRGKPNAFDWTIVVTRNSKSVLAMNNSEHLPC